MLMAHTSKKYKALKNKLEANTQSMANIILIWLILRYASEEFLESALDNDKVQTSIKDCIRYTIKKRFPNNPKWYIRS